MARDRIATLKDGRPTLEELHEAATRYLGGAGWIAGRLSGFVCFLPGSCSSVWRPGSAQVSGRGFEVHCVADGDDPHIDVITRMADEYTNAVADGFFAAIVRRWELEAEGE